MKKNQNRMVLVRITRNLQGGVKQVAPLVLVLIPRVCGYFGPREGRIHENTKTRQGPLSRLSDAALVTLVRSNPRDQAAFAIYGWKDLAPTL